MTGPQTRSTSVHTRALVILWLLIALYVANFVVLSLRQDAAFETGAADLGNMNQAAWYTLHAGYPADSFAGHVLTRFAGHVEPIYYLIAIPYALHQTAGLLLVLQTLIIAVGAVAAYMLGRDVLQSESAGLVFAFAYLLFPSLQAANLTEFHPVALASSLLLLAFYYLQKRRYGPFFLFALLAMSTKEDMSLLVVMLGLFAIVQALRRSPSPRPSSAPAKGDTGDQPAHRATGSVMAAALPGLAAVILGAAWFFLTVYVIIPHFSATGDVVLFQRYAEVGGSPQGLLRAILSDPIGVIGRVLAPEKLAYLAGLLASTGFLALLAPWALLLAAPSLGINMLSNYQPMYSGLSHYSAPIVPLLIIGAIYGAHFARSLIQRRLHIPERRAMLAVLVWVLLTSTFYQTLVGFTPLSIHYRLPGVTTHNRLLERFTQQIPADASVSVQTPLHPHLSSRALVYPFPEVKDASYVLLDVTARPTMHPNDLQRAFQALLRDDGFGIVDAADGYILLKKGTANKELPDSFYSAFRAASPQPQYPVVVDFGASLRLLGYDIEDVDEGRQPWTRLRFYWQVNGPLPDDLRIYPYYVDDAGSVIEDTAQRPLVTVLWLPPERWQPGEVIVTQTLPWPVGDSFRVAVGVMSGSDWTNAATRLPAQLVKSPLPVQPLDGGTAVEVGRFLRVVSLQSTQAPAPQPSHRLRAQFGEDVRLLGYDATGSAKPGETVSLTLYWQALTQPAEDYHTFAHIYNAAGKVAAQEDGVTGGAIPTSWWARGQVVTETYTIAIPAGAEAGLQQSLAVGLYRLDSGARLPVVGGSGQQPADMILIPLERPR